VKGGSRWENKQNQLPEGNYKEYDVQPKVKGQPRSSERFVTGDDGSIYWTDTHYGDKPGEPFYKVK